MLMKDHQCKHSKKTKTASLFEYSHLSLGVLLASFKTYCVRAIINLEKITRVQINNAAIPFKARILLMFDKICRCW